MYDNKNKIITVLILAAVVFSMFTIYIYSSDKPITGAKAAALYEPETKSFLYTKNEHARLGMASTTKIMTALIALESLDPEKTIETDKRAVGIEGSSLYLEEGEALSVLDLIYGLILQSANDAATVLALEISGNVEDFAILMTNRAKELGLCDTEFKNPHGLDADGHYTSAHDLAIITAHALSNESFRKIASTYKKEIVSSHKTRILVNHNKLLKSYEGCIGVKTGYTKKTGRSLVSAAEREGLTLIAVTLNAPDDWSDHRKMLDYGYSFLRKENLAKELEYRYEIPVISGEKEKLYISNRDAFSYIHENDGSEFDVSVKLQRYCQAPIKEGDIMGSVIFTQNGKKIGEIPLTAEETVNIKEKKGFFSRFKK